MEHTIANFRALRETVGMTQAHVAKECGIDARSVRRWEDAENTAYAPREFAWDLLIKAREDQIRAIDEVITAVERMEDECGTPKVVRLSYWGNAVEYARAHPEEDPAKWQMANANARLAGHMLMEMGFDIEFGFHGLMDTVSEERG